MEQFQGPFYSLMEYSKAEEIPIILASGSNMMGITDSRLEFLQDRSVRAVLQLSKLIAIKPIQRARSLKLAAVKHGTTVGSYRLEFETHQDFQAIVDFLDSQRSCFTFDTAARSYIRVTNGQSQPSQLLNAFIAKEHKKSPSHALQSSVQFPVIRRNIYESNSDCPARENDELFGSKAQGTPASSKKARPRKKEEAQSKPQKKQQTNSVWHTTTTNFNTAPEKASLAQGGRAFGNESDGENGDDGGAGTCESFSPASPSFGSPEQRNFAVQQDISRRSTASKHSSGDENVEPPTSVGSGPELDASRRQSISQPMTKYTKSIRSLRPAAASSTSSKSRPNDAARRHDDHQRNLQVGAEMSNRSLRGESVRPGEAGRMLDHGQGTHKAAKEHSFAQSIAEAARVSTGKTAARTAKPTSVPKKRIKSSQAAVHSVQNKRGKRVSKVLKTTPASLERQPKKKTKTQQPKPKAAAQPTSASKTTERPSPIKRKADAKLHETRNESLKMPRSENHQPGPAAHASGSRSKDDGPSAPMCTHAGCQTDCQVVHSNQAVELDLPDLLSKLVR